MIALGLFLSCSKEPAITDPMNDFNVLETISVDSKTLTIYATKPRWEVGYNKVYFKMEDGDGKLVKNTSLSWMPLMHMVSKTHSCPVSEITPSEFEGIQSSFVIFQMPSNESEYWDISFNLSVDGTSMAISKEVNVHLPSDSRKNVTTFLDAAENKYVLALLEPSNPKIAVNDIEMKLYKMESMRSFSVVPNGKIALDPRMPSMDNHSSPNNQDLYYNELSQSYQGKLSLTMSGYWKLNLQWYDAQNSLVAGSQVTDENTSSSLYLELEF